MRAWLAAFLVLAMRTGVEAGETPRVSGPADGFPEKAHLHYARGFTIEYHDTYKVVEVLTPWTGARETFRYVLVPRGMPAPGDIGNAQVVEVPIRTIAVLSTTHLPHLERLGVLNSLIAMATPDRAYSPVVRQRVADGKVAEVGRGGALNLERVLALTPDLVMATGQANPQGNAHPALLRAGIRVAINSEYVEPTLLGRTEWIKFTSAFFNKEGLAERLFGDIVARYDTYKVLTQSLPADRRPTVFGGSLFRGTWNMAGGNSWVAQLLRDAGANYLWAEDNTERSLPLSFEQVYERASQADFWLTERNEWRTLRDVLAADERYSGFKAFQQGKVYNRNARLSPTGSNDYWEAGMVEPDVLLADIIKILHPDLLPDHSLKYFQKLP